MDGRNDRHDHAVESTTSSNGIELKFPKNRELLGGDLLAQSLHSLGVRVAFGVHGGHLDAFLMGCHDIGIDLVDTRHETVAVQAAEGYAKVAGKVGTCFVTANSGFSNGLPGLATAFADRSPIFCVTSSAPLRDAETNCLQGFHDQVVLARPMTKFVHRVTTVEEIPRLVAHAFRSAYASPPGPVVLDFPIDVLFSPPSLSRVAWGSVTSMPHLPPAPNIESAKLVLEALRQSERPCIIASTGARGLEAGKELERFMELTNIPVFSSSKFSTDIPSDHRLRGGIASKLAALPLIGQKQPDLIVLLGARMGFLLGGRTGHVLPLKNCKYVQVDVDGSEIGRMHPIDIGIVSDVTQALTVFNAELESHPIPKASEEWTKVLLGLRHLPMPSEKEPMEMTPQRPHPYHAVKKLLQSLDPGAIIIIDGGEAGCWVQDLIEQARASLYLAATGYLGFLGNGWGYSLGASVAAPGKQVINIQGDGSALFHIGELDTFCRHALNILTVVINNYCWGMSRAGQDLLYEGVTDARPVSKLSPSTAFEIIAQGFGCASARADTIEDIEGAIRILSKEKRPSCLNLIVSDKPIHPVTRSMVNPTDDKNYVVVPYYDNIPRPYYKV